MSCLLKSVRHLKARTWTDARNRGHWRRLSFHSTVKYSVQFNSVPVFNIGLCVRVFIFNHQDKTKTFGRPQRLRYMYNTCMDRWSNVLLTPLFHTHITVMLQPFFLLSFPTFCLRNRASSYAVRQGVTVARARCANKGLRTGANGRRGSRAAKLMGIYGDR